MSTLDHPPRPWVIFADDWGRHPSSCQHLIRPQLGQRDVIWVNTIGTRPPRLDWSTMRRVFNKLGQWLKPGSVHATTSQSPTILAPKMWPSFQRGWQRRLNRKLLLRSLLPVVEQLPQSPNVITTLPLIADLIGRLPVHRWIYYCVDDFSVWPGYDGPTMRRLEAELVPKVEEVIAVSDTLVQHLAKWNRTAKLLTHGVDLAHWRQETTPHPALTGPEPRFVFWGVIDRRLDLQFLQALNDRFETGQIVMIGPTEDPDPKLFQLSRVRIMPPVSYADLPQVAAASTVLMMPYTDAPVTRAMQPLKLKEYLATGKPVVVRDLPATRPWSDALSLAATPAAFTEAVATAVRCGVTDEQRLARQRLERESWTEKSKVFAQWVEGEACLPSA